MRCYGGSELMDKIKLKRLAFYGYHGLFPEENKLGQRFYVDVELFLSLQKAGKSDKMEDSIDYGAVYEMIRSIVEGEPKNLIEAVAEAIAQSLLENFAALHACQIEVTKPDPPIAGQYDAVSVQIYRERQA